MFKNQSILVKSVFSILLGIMMLGFIPNVIADEGFLQYTNEKYQFQIQYPAEWDIREDSKPNGFDVTFEKPIQGNDCDTLFLISVDKDVPTNFDDYIDKKLGGLFNEVSNLKISDSDYSTFLNHNSFTVNYSGIPYIVQPGCNNFEFWETYLIKNENGFLIRYMTEQQDAAMQNAFQQMINSIELDIFTTELDLEQPKVVEQLKIPQTNYNVKIKFNLAPSVIETNDKNHQIGYIQTVDSDGTPISAPADLMIKLSSTNPEIVEVDEIIVHPYKKEISVFDVKTKNKEGSSIITAEFQNQVLLQEIFVGGEFVSQVLQDVDLEIHMPTTNTLINSVIPFSVFMQSNGTALQAPKDIPVLLEYQENLIKIPSDEIIIKKGTYYALSTFETLGNEGNAFLRAKTLQPTLDTIENINVTSTKPVELFVTILPEEIARTETSIDLFIGLLDFGGNPTLAPENIPISIFSDQPEFESSINESIQPRGAIIKKGEFGFHLKHEYIFLTLPDDKTITIGASTAGLKVGTDTFELLKEPLSADHKKAIQQVVKVFTVEKMPLGAKAIAVYQLRAIEIDEDDKTFEIQKKIDVISLQIENAEDDKEEHEKDITDLKKLISDLEDDNKDTTTEEKDLNAKNTSLSNLKKFITDAKKRLDTEKERLKVAKNDHPIDDLDEGETYPIQSRSNYIQDNSLQSIRVISYDEDRVTILDSGILGITKSYGTIIIQSGQKKGETEISAVLGGIGTGSATIKVLGSSNPESTKVFSPVGEKNLVFNSQGVIDLILLPIDNGGRPTVSANPLEYLLKPTNDFVTINPGENFARIEIQSSSFGKDLARGNSTMTVIPIGVDAKNELETELIFKLIPSSSIITPIFPFDMTTGIDNENNGIVQLVDFFGNPVPVTNDLTVFLDSSDSNVVDVPYSITIERGNSYATFPITVSTTDGTTQITAEADGFTSGNTDINTKSYSNELKLYIDPITQPLSIGKDITVKIFVDDLNAKPIEGASVIISGGENIEIDPKTMISDSTGAVTTTIKAISGSDITLTIQADKPGFSTATTIKELKVSVGTSDDFLGIPSWVIYAMIAVIVGIVAVGVFFFMRKPEEIIEEEEDEDI